MPLLGNWQVLISQVSFSVLIGVKREQMCVTLNIMTEALNDKYLGLPVNVGMDKLDFFCI